MQCSAVQCSAVQCSAVQCSEVKCSAVQCSAVQCIPQQSSPIYILVFSLRSFITKFKRPGREGGRGDASNKRDKIKYTSILNNVKCHHHSSSTSSYGHHSSYNLLYQHHSYMKHSYNPTYTNFNPQTYFPSTNTSPS